MKFILSPSKRQNTGDAVLLAPTTTPSFLESAKAIAKVMSSLSEGELREKLTISEKLGAEVFGMWNDWGRSTKAPKSAIELFQGDVYDGLDFPTLTQTEKERAAQNVLIMSALYGVLRGSDFTNAYRLDLKDKIQVDGLSLTAFWKRQIGKDFPVELQSDLFVDLTSTEYTAMLPKPIREKSIRIDFKEEVNGKLKTVSFFAKRARGVFARWMVQESVEFPKGLKVFNLEGYSFNQEASSERLWVFSRKSVSR